MSVTSARLAGVPLLALERVGWRFTQGFEAYQRIFELKKSDAEHLFSTATGEVELNYVRDGVPLSVKGLKVLSLAPATHPDRLGVLVSDRRWAWDRVLVVRDYNVKRRSGEMRLVDGNLQRIPPSADLTYAKFSKKDEVNPWTAVEVLADILNEVTLGQFVIGGADLSKSVQVEGFALRDLGPSAVRVAISYFPGLAVYVDENGITRTTTITGGAEEAELAAAGPPLVGATLSAKIDLSHVRPSGIDIYFQPEDEGRFDFLDGITATGPQASEPRILVNVMPLPDTVVINGRRVVQGTLVPIDQNLLDGWNNDTANPPVVTVGSRSHRLPPITFAVILRLFLCPGGYNAYFEIAQQGTKIWGRRWAAIMQHFRQTFMLPRRWADRCYSMRAERLAIVDPELGTRAASDVYADHAVIPTKKRLAFTRNDVSKKYALNHLAWPNGDTQRLLVSGSVCESAVLTMVDEDQFVFKTLFAPLGSQVGDVQAVLPCAMTSAQTGETPDIPEGDVRAAQALFLLHLGRLSAKHRYSTVVTLAPASPQGLSHLYKISVSPEEAKSVLPSGIASRVGGGRGPRMSLFVGPDVATARFAWRDEDALEIEGAILQGKPRNKARLLDPTHIQDVAVAFAASAYSIYADRWEGTRAVAFDPKRKPVGSIQSVVHDLMPSGEFATILNMVPGFAPIDFMALLPESARRQLFRKVQP